jgi:hypothetical protein
VSGNFIPGNLCIYIVSPENYIHSHAFDEHALSLHHAFRELGYTVPIIRNSREISGTPIVLGANLLPHLGGICLPVDSVLYNLEQIQQGSPWLKPDYMDLLRQYQVWDYSLKNIVALEDAGIKEVKLCRVGYVPELTRIPQLPEPEQDIDVLFYGSLNPRRREILTQLKEQGLRVEAFFGLYGLRRDSLIARAKMVINIHFYESKVMEIVRLAYLMANKKFIVSERGNDEDLEQPFEKGIILADYEALVDECLTYVADAGKRNRISATGHEAFRSHRQADFLKAVFA